MMFEKDYFWLAQVMEFKYAFTWFLAIFNLNGWARVNQHLPFSIKSPCLWASFHMQTFLSVRSIKSSMKCWNSVFNTQGSRLIIVPVQVGAMKICVVAVEALKTKEREGSNHDETLFTTNKKWCFSEFQPPLNADVFFCRFFKNLTRFWTKLRVMVLCFPDFTKNFNI